ncbi:phosphotyrosine protein [Papiliotrema laurentii]|uniref:Phosphotyrosine protein n=1 Tax=Papiliotrema laurentii TaxID=5418 RepID=A0AAD9CY64_PAPLA|nr:phosphotyrosine protein [Papiliotrema laurentii]
MTLSDAFGAPLTPPSPPAVLAQEWRYEMRREAQEIIPGLYLGPFQSSVNLAMMNSLKITHVLCIRDRKEASLIFPRFPTEFRYMTLDISDNTDQNIISIFPACRDFIEEAINSNGVVLAHCNGGIATAPAIVIGYLMWKFSWNFDRALSYVQSKRYCVSPMSFTVQLKEYEPIYIAEKMMALSGTTNSSRDKRQYQDSDDEEEIMRKLPSRRDESTLTNPDDIDMS